MTKEIMHKIYEMNQEELRDFIKGILNDKNIPYVEHDGNIYSFRFNDKVAFVSHLDTVAKSDEEYHKPVFEYNGILFKRKAILGADDRAGVNIILNHIDDINFILTRDEEIGRLGAASLRKNEDFVEAIKVYNIVGFIEMDRKNNSDILGHNHGYCQEDFHNAVLNVLSGRVDAHGLCTDIDSFIDLRAGVNLSCGYHSPHTENEFLDIESWLVLNNSIPELNKITGEFKLPVKKSAYTYSSKYNIYDYIYKGTQYYSKKNNGYGDLFKYSYYDDSYMDAVAKDIEYTKRIRAVVGIHNYNEVENTEDGDTLNIIKESSKYMECAYCGKMIRSGARYHIISEAFIHDACLLEHEKTTYGILPIKDGDTKDDPKGADK